MLLFWEQLKLSPLELLEMAEHSYWQMGGTETPEQQQVLVHWAFGYTQAVGIKDQVEHLQQLQFLQQEVDLLARFLLEAVVERLQTLAEFKHLEMEEVGPMQLLDAEEVLEEASMPVEQLQTEELEDSNTFTTERWPVALLWGRMAFPYQPTFLMEAAVEVEEMPVRQSQQCLEAMEVFMEPVVVEVERDKDLIAALVGLVRKELLL
jgi:hypothetical protein